MFYAHSHQERAFNFFASFIRNVINGDDRYKSLVEPIISDAQQLAKNEKNYYAISRSDYDIIVFLAEKGKDFFKELDIHEIKEADYQHILDLVTAQKELFLA